MYYIKGQQLKLLDPKKYGLGSRTVIGEANDGQLFLIKDRQSRIIMKDGMKILEQINSIKRSANADRVVLTTQAPICGKTTKLFVENEIKVVALEK